MKIPSVFPNKMPPCSSIPLLIWTAENVIFNQQIMRSKIISLISLALAGLLFNGCASTKQLADVVNPQDPHPDTALIVVQRPSSMLAASSALRVVDGEKIIGKLGPGGQLVWTRPPGVCALLIDGNDDYGNPPSITIFEAKQGATYSFKPRIGMGGGKFDRVLPPGEEPQQTHIYIESATTTINPSLLPPEFPMFFSPSLVNKYAPYVADNELTPSTVFQIEFAADRSLSFTNTSPGLVNISVRNSKTGKTLWTSAYVVPIFIKPILGQKVSIIIPTEFEQAVYLMRYMPILLPNGEIKQRVKTVL
jgi:hypothetical protein